MVGVGRGHSLVVVCGLLVTVGEEYGVRSHVTVKTQVAGVFKQMEWCGHEELEFEVR